MVSSHVPDERRRVVFSDRPDISTLAFGVSEYISSCCQGVVCKCCSKASEMLSLVIQVEQDRKIFPRICEEQDL